MLLHSSPIPRHLSKRNESVYPKKKTNVGMVIAVSFAVAQTGHDTNVPQCTTALLGCVKEWANVYCEFISKIHWAKEANDQRLLTVCFQVQEQAMLTDNDGIRKWLPVVRGSNWQEIGNFPRWLNCLVLDWVLVIWVLHLSNSQIHI